MKKVISRVLVASVFFTFGCMHGLSSQHLLAIHTITWNNHFLVINPIDGQGKDEFQVDVRHVTVRCVPGIKGTSVRIVGLFGRIGDIWDAAELIVGTPAEKEAWDTAIAAKRQEFFTPRNISPP